MDGQASIRILIRRFHRERRSKDLLGSIEIECRDLPEFTGCRDTISKRCIVL